MKKDTILGIILGILYYVLSAIFYFYLYIIEALAGNISDFSSVLFYFCYAVLPIIFLAISSRSLNLTGTLLRFKAQYIRTNSSVQGSVPPLRDK